MFARLNVPPTRAVGPLAGFLSLIWFVVYLTTMSPTVNFIDSGELITALHEPGVAHPPGYPLYTLLGYVASQIPIGEIAARVNAMSAFWGALAVGAFFLLIYGLSRYIQPQAPVQVRAGRARSGRPNPSDVQKAARVGLSRPESVEWRWIAGAAGGASLLAASSTFWSRTAQAKMYTLHYFLLAVLLLLVLQARSAYDENNHLAFKRRLTTLAFVFGLSMTNHLMTVLVAVPVALFLVVGDRPGERTMAVVRLAPRVIPAFVLPLLLYLYMPLRASQSPVMNWGSTDSWGDFWRHVTGWQFRAYLEGDLSGNVGRNSSLLTGYFIEQWNILTSVVVLAALVGAVLLARVNLPAFVATTGFVIASLIFDLVYGISEIEPYAVPIYAIVCIWAGLVPAAWRAWQGRARTGKTSDSVHGAVRYVTAATAVLLVLALGSAVLNYPRQNYSQNRLAEQFVLNVFSELPQNSIVITDYWDFAAPTYYLQLIQGVRPDVVVIDMSLLRYPWYSKQLEKRYPWLVEKSRDVLAAFSAEQRRWVNGENYNPQAINDGYFNLLASFIERNYPEYTPFVIWLQDCPPGAQCDTNLVARDWTRQPVGLTYRLWPPGTSQPTMPPEPSYNLAGITSSPVSFDIFARANSSMYRTAYLRLADLYARSGSSDAAARMEARAREVASALEGR